MKLYVMRHGPAEDHAATGRDQDRALTPKGRDRVREVVHLLEAENEMPARILTSPLLRAAQTAEIVGAAGNLAPEVAPELGPTGRALDLVKRLRGAGISTVVVGHEPDLSELVEQLLGAPMPEPMEKAMVVALELDHESRATLRFIMDPKRGEIVHDARPIEDGSP